MNKKFIRVQYFVTRGLIVKDKTYVTKFIKGQNYKQKFSGKL